jgi:hypothetical protein
MEDQFEHTGHTYRVEGLTPMVEFHVARRMSAALVSVVIDSMRRGDKESLLPEIMAWGAMSDADVEFVVNNCMGAVRRRDPQRESWQPVWTAGRPMFADIDRETMMHLVREVLRIRIGPFLPEGDQTASGANPGATGQNSPTETTG